MASGFQKALGGAAAGAGAGSFGGPLGAGIGAAVGGIGSFLFGGGDDQEPTPISYADISLAKDNPELFAKIRQNDALLAEAKRLYDQSYNMPTPAQQYAYDQYMSTIGRGFANAGIAGSPDAIAQSASLQNQYLRQMQDDVQKNRLGLFQNYSTLAGRGYDETRGALNDVARAREGNNQLSENALGASNQFYSGLFNGGLQLGAHAYAMNNMPSAQYSTGFNTPPAPQSYGPPPSNNNASSGYGSLGNWSF